MNKKWWVLLSIVVVVAGLYFAASAYFANIVIAAPTRTLDESLASSEWGSKDALLDEFSMPEPEDVSIDAGDVTLSGWYFDNPAQGECAVLFLHGYTGTRTHGLWYTPLFWERGCDLLTYDARGHGDSDEAFHSYGYFEKQDAVAAFDWLANRTQLAPEQIGVIGVSYGAATALQAAPLLPDACFLLADSPYRSLDAILAHQGSDQFGEWVRAFLPGGYVVINLRAGYLASDVAPEDAIADAQTPTFIVHSQQDTFTPPDHSQAIYDNANPDLTTLHLLDWGSPHAAMIAEYPERYADLFDAFVDAYDLTCMTESTGR